jgi:hypothetical protein
MPQIGEPVPAPRVTRRRPRDEQAMAAVQALIEAPEGYAIPCQGWEGDTPEEREANARKFGNRVQGYAERDHGLKVHASFDPTNATLYLSVAATEAPADGATHHSSE